MGQSVRSRNEDSVMKCDMKRISVKWAFIFVPLSIFIMCVDGFAQLREEVEEKKDIKMDIDAFEREVRKEKQEEKMYKILSSIQFSASYETNPRLTSIRKEDSAGHLKYSLLFKRPLVSGVLFNFSYNIDASGYSELNDLTNVLNHSRLSIDKFLNKSLGFGVGYDFSNFYYPEEGSSDFYFHKGFVYMKHNFTKKLYQQVMLEEGIKDYIHTPAHLDSTYDFEDDDRRDYRHGAEYSLGASLTEKLFFRFRAKFSVNDANALYQNYHDYKSLDFSSYISYKISEKYLINLSMTVSDKEYKNRLVAAQSYERQDDSYSGNIGARYNVNQNNTVSLDYGYNESNSNDPTTEYTSSSINCGWQYKF